MNIFETWRQSIKDAQIYDFFSTYDYSSGGKTEKIRLPTKSGYTMVGLMIKAASTLTATAAENVDSGSPTESMLDTLKNIEVRVGNKVRYSFRTPGILEAVLRYFSDEDIVASGGKKASEYSNFSGAGTSSEEMCIILPIVIGDNEEATIRWEMNSITTSYSANISYSTFAYELTPIYGNWEGELFGIESNTISVPANGQKSIHVQLSDETRLAEIINGIGADTYIDNLLVADESGTTIVNSEGDQLIGYTENTFENTRETGEFVVSHMPSLISSYLLENSHSSAITPEVVSVYLRGNRPATSAPPTTPEAPRPSPPIPEQPSINPRQQPQLPYNVQRYKGIQNIIRKKKRGGLLGNLRL